LPFSTSLWRVPSPEFREEWEEECMKGFAVVSWDYVSMSIRLSSQQLGVPFVKELRLVKYL
jgi:hypothetical protein